MTIVSCVLGNIKLVIMPFNIIENVAISEKFTLSPKTQAKLATNFSDWRNEKSLEAHTCNYAPEMPILNVARG